MPMLHDQWLTTCLGTRGAEACNGTHPEELDPGLFAIREHQSYEVPKEPGVACKRCVQAGRYCDKKDRGPDPKNPCPECRRFGGANVECVLAPDQSYNDGLWATLQSRINGGYTTLPDRDVGRVPRVHTGEMKPRKPKPQPGPMPDEKVMDGWEGATAEELMEQDMLPDFVRPLPRAYLEPPGSTGRSRNYVRHEAHIGDVAERKRKREASPVAPREAAYVPVFPQPPDVPPHPVYGRFLRMVWEDKSRDWTVEYERGDKITSPPFDRMAPPTGQVPAVCCLRCAISCLLLIE